MSREADIEKTGTVSYTVNNIECMDPRGDNLNYLTSMQATNVLGVNKVGSNEKSKKGHRCFNTTGI